MAHFICHWLTLFNNGILIVILSMTVVATAQGYKGIVPFHSTCESVKETFHVDKCDSRTLTFDMEKETVTINFSTKECHTAYGECFKLPLGTVTSIVVGVKLGRMIPLKEFRQDLSGFEVIEKEAAKIYSSKKEGIEIAVVDDYFISYILYIATEQDLINFKCDCCKKSPKQSDH